MRIIFFNHKGGVSKTTTTFHLGWKLAQNGSRVLLVDADPQCNLTGLIMKDSFEQYYTDAPTNTRNIMAGVSSAFEGRPEPIQAFDCYNVPNNDNLFLLPGHPNLTELEPALSFAQTSNNAFATMQNLPGAFNALIALLCDHHNIDYVITDLNPGLGAINQNLFSISDLFIIPTNPDPFSLMAIKTLSNVLPRWYQASQQMRSLFAASAYPFPEKNPKLAGIILQRFNIRSGKPAAPFRNNMDEIIEEVSKVLIPSLLKSNMLLENDLYRDTGIPTDYCLAEIPDFQSLLPQSNVHGVPVYALTDEQMERTGTVLAQMVAKRELFDQQFIDFAHIIEQIKENA
ncbi:MAG: ParA family protein [Flavobacterium nitrogenifigens]|uniref:ParA family protein n=1 Tax=Flavobacterium nitrogenifigens TaxID=1617283 RepID=UPI0028074F39|nr:ParA family protein [Flavobacterium nitrogenifigens]MDQ8015280.1 ParA family protein [Flavobacterium nitrogenifigens]MDQ8053438.1 ParA family protein [Pedobacter sp.]